MFFAGIPADGSNWRVEIEDPQNPRATVACMDVGEGAVVTSSIMKRSWNQDGQTKHHIIDPRTGEPAEPEWVSVTVIAPRADLAEAYAKAFLIGGQQAAPGLLLQQPSIAVIGIRADGQVWTSPRAKEYLNGCTEYVRQQPVQQ